jgi:tetratricopeptide (TPR) repeat protein
MRWKFFGLTALLFLLGGCAASRYSTAEKHLENKQYEKAIRQYLKLLDPHMKDGRRFIYYDREAISGIGMTYWHMQRFETGARILRAVVNKDPDFGKARFYLGLCYEGMNQEEEALNIYKNYYLVPITDPYRKVLVGRKDYFVRRKIAREIQAALQAERDLQVSEMSEDRVAVLYFLSLSDDPQWTPLQKGLAEMMITDLSQVSQLDVVERLRLQYLMEEMQMGVTGFMNEENTPRVGKLLGAGTMIKGSYMVMPDLRMTMDAAIFQVGKIAAPSSSDLEGDLARLFRMEKELVFRVLDHYGIELTPKEREKILEIPTKDMMAFLYYCRGLDAMDRYDFDTAQENFEKAVRMDPNFTRARDWVTSSTLWDATHKSNFVRVRHEVAQLIQAAPRGGLILTAEAPPLVTPWNRLVWMGRFQDTYFLPGNESREAFSEADLGGALVLPELLGDPPLPPQR